MKKFSEYVKGILNEEDEEGMEGAAGAEGGEGGEGDEGAAKATDVDVVYTVECADKGTKVKKLLDAIKKMGAGKFDIVINPGDEEKKIAWDGETDIIEKISAEKMNEEGGEAGEEGGEGEKGSKE